MDRVLVSSGTPWRNPELIEVFKRLELGPRIDRDVHRGDLLLRDSGVFGAARGSPATKDVSDFFGTVQSRCPSREIFLPVCGVQ